ncbi:hypothetical protein D1970_06265 [Mesobacillus zeae]|uniref:Uncharacterized protein n=1 Tax=Mesobacillus zeae TaxID=1917180 RepID=A0A398BAK8_9BACI|nr:hypothetical protein D1970_06265 [Mesobacillus zeae]
MASVATNKIVSTLRNADHTFLVPPKPQTARKKEIIDMYKRAYKKPVLSLPAGIKKVKNNSQQSIQRRKAHRFSLDFKKSPAC